MDIFCCCFERERPTAWTGSSCVSWLKKQRVESADELHAVILEHFTRFPPSPSDMATLSILQQRFEGTMGIYDYACTTVYLCAQEAIMEASYDTEKTLQSISSFNELSRLSWMH